MKSISILTFVALTIACALPAQSLTIPTVPVGNAGNVDDSTGYGGVNYNYRMGKTEVTNTEYVEFLNAVAKSDPYGLYSSNMGSNTRGGITRSNPSGSYSYTVKSDAIGFGPGGSDYTYGDKPAYFISWYDTLRFANWLHNGQGSGDTETGSYTLGELDANGIPINGNITRNAGATWVLPNEDEWYKAAYHQNDGVSGNYWTYPTSTNDEPDNNLPAADTGNSANYRISPNYTTGDSNYPFTDAGAYTLSESPYGTFDQAGNAYEWNEPIVSTTFANFRVMRGGNYFWDETRFRKIDRDGNTPANGSLGFRVARVPEPSSLLLAALVLPALYLRRRRGAKR